MKLRTCAGVIHENCSRQQAHDALHAMEKDEVEFVILERGEVDFMQTCPAAIGYVLEVKASEKGHFTACNLDGKASPELPPLPEAEPRKWYEFWKAEMPHDPDEGSLAISQIKAAFDSYIDGTDFSDRFRWKEWTA